MQLLATPNNHRQNLVINEMLGGIKEIREHIELTIHTLHSFDPAAGNQQKWNWQLNGYICSVPLFFPEKTAIKRLKAIKNEL